MNEWTDAQKRLPRSESMYQKNPTIYGVDLGFAYGICEAMFLNNEWYLNHFAKIIVPILRWREK